jgi:hypothetical protein
MLLASWCDASGCLDLDVDLDASPFAQNKIVYTSHTCYCSKIVRLPRVQDVASMFLAQDSAQSQMQNDVINKMLSDLILGLR